MKFLLSEIIFNMLLSIWQLVLICSSAIKSKSLVRWTVVIAIEKIYASTFLFSSCPISHIGCTDWKEKMELPLFWQVKHLFIIIPYVNSLTPTQIQNFSTEILHGTFEYSAYGFFTINHAALIGVRRLLILNC